MLREAAYIGGEWTASRSGEAFPVDDPATGAVIASVANCAMPDFRAVIAAAKTAQVAWAQRTGKERAQILRRLFDLTLANQDDLAVLLTAETGKPLAEAKAEIAYGASYIEWFGEEAKRAYDDVIPGHRRDARLLVLKPAAETPLPALALAALAERAGLPAGLLNVTPTRTARTFGEEVCTNPAVKKLSFTGSTEVGRQLMAQAAPKIMKLSLELGGNAPLIVFDDADLAAAVKGAMDCKFRNNGQTCVSATWLYPQVGIHLDGHTDVRFKERALTLATFAQLPGAAVIEDDKTIDARGQASNSTARVYGRLGLGSVRPGHSPSIITQIDNQWGHL